MSAATNNGPLAGVRVLDLGGAIAGPLVGMLLADQGADVIRVIRPRSPDRGLDAVLDRGKRCIAVDLLDPRDRKSIDALIANADIVVENHSAEARYRLMIRASDIHAINPAAICVSLPGAADGDDWLQGAKAYEGIIAAATAQFTNIHPSRALFGLDPVYTALPIASVYAGVHGATAATLALRRRVMGGGGAAIEVPLLNAALSAMSSLHLKVDNQPDRYSAPRLPASLRRIVLPLLRQWARRGGADVQARLLGIARKSYPALMTSYRCADGRQLYLFAIDNAKLVRSALKVLGLLDEVLAGGLVFEDPFAAGDRRDNLAETSNLSRAWQTQLTALIAAKMAQCPAAEWEHRLNAAGVPCATVRTTAEWLGLAEVHSAGLLVKIDDDRFGVMVQPGPQAIVRSGCAATGAPQRRHQVHLHEGIAWEQSAKPAETPSLPPCAPGAWLEGLTVIDMTSMVAGPVAGRTLAEYGARVIKVESPAPNHGPRLTCWYGIDGNQGKESVLLDLKTDVGRKAMLQLLDRADVLVTNHSALAMEAMGLGEAALREVKPDLIQCRIGAYNGPHDGLWASRPGYDPVLQAAAGIMARYGDAQAPELHAIASCVDALTGYSATFGMALALLGKAKGTPTPLVDASLAAAATLVQLPFAFDHAGRKWAEPGGQAAVGEHALYRLYRACDGWLFVAAPSADISALPIELRPGNASDNGTHVDRIALAIRRRRSADVIGLLRAAGLSAVPVQSIDTMARGLAGRARARLHLVRHNIPGLGPITIAPASRCRVSVPWHRHKSPVQVQHGCSRNSDSMSKRCSSPVLLPQKSRAIIFLEPANMIILTGCMDQHGKAHTCRYRPDPPFGNAPARAASSWLGKRSSDHGGAQPAQSAVGVAYSLGASDRSKGLSGDAGALRSDVAEHPLNAPRRAQGGRHRCARQRRQLGADATRPQDWTGAEGARRLVGRMGSRHQGGPSRLSKARFAPIGASYDC